MVQSADLFAIIGTSLVVYPAAGLIHYAARHIPKYIVDKIIPPGSFPISNYLRIEKPATEGIVDLVDILRQNHL